MASQQSAIFSYEELLEATSFFNPSEVVGEGGFGIVYRGKLKDGRTVAVKDLHVRHPKRIEQFLTEVTVLSRIRHRNLVSLYGSTNPETRKLLLIYEFVPNGTLADHLFGKRITEGSLSWDMRIRIAVETAEALSYLHSLQPPVIHRDIKTDNILLDNSFTVKVADLGNCRLLPSEAGYVETAPQGTQGYLDPEYNQCLKLTDKSDVYSFGVVLLELISGKKAVDTDRNADEIWLSRMALIKMKNKEMEKLVDPELGYCSDLKMMWMVGSVTELALRCLTPKGNTRPTMMEILRTLKSIRDVKIMSDDVASSTSLACSDDSSSASDSPERSSRGLREKMASTGVGVGSVIRKSFQVLMTPAELMRDEQYYGWGSWEQWRARMLEYNARQPGYLEGGYLIPVLEKQENMARRGRRIIENITLGRRIIKNMF